MTRFRLPRASKRELPLFRAHVAGPELISQETAEGTPSPPLCPRSVVFVRHLVYNTAMATKSERLSLRLTPAQDVVLRTAADARGESTSDYVLRHAVEAAEMDLADRRVFVVDDTAWTELQQLISAQPDLPLPMAKLLSNPSVLDLPAG